MSNKLELTWVGKNDEIKVEPRLLIEDKEKSNCVNDPSTENMIIHGDNLLALKALEDKYSGKVKFIYIDPPYNTGKAFDHYDDNIEHSIWLKLMHKRLKILRNLLADDGVLCCQIDDSEGSYLKIMLDEIFGRENYLVTFYMQVRYANKTLAEDSDYQKVIEQCHIYSKNKKLAKINRPIEEYSLEKFKWKVIEKEKGELVELGGKIVEIFKPEQYNIVEVPSNIDGLKETWATGSLSRVKASAGEFFELYLSERKTMDGLGVLYKVSGIGEDGLGYRYISGPKKDNATKGKFYSGVPISRREEILNGSSLKYKPVPNFYDFAGSFGNCRLEGGVDFRGGKKPEVLLKQLLEYFTEENDLVLDSFLGSGTSIAVAHKMNRRYIGIEMGEHAYSHCKTRLDNIIAGNDKSGVTFSKELHEATSEEFENLGFSIDELKIFNKILNKLGKETDIIPDEVLKQVKKKSKLKKIKSEQLWKGGGAYKFYELAPSLINKDDFDEYVINSEYDADMLASAVALHEGFIFQPNKEVFWKQSLGSENSYLFVTTRHIDVSYIDSIQSTMKEDEFLIIACKSYSKDVEKRYPNIILKKIPQMLLNRCEFDKENYNLNIINPPIYEEEEGDEY
ncbi:site-specific DNA-methyltransferase [Streptococcus sanguinis]|uniref:site-specific DNA-methyltransferase n=1 Tax=Streptococcus sanguinis TaxID=1305 RepID=UPI0031B5B341